MANKTFGQLKAEVQLETDTEAEDFVQATELKNYFDSGIRIVEAELIKAGVRDKYLQKEATISIVSGTAAYDLPADIIDTKIRKIIYRNGIADIYELTPATREDSYLEQDVNRIQNTNVLMQYMVYKTTNKYQIQLTPIPSVSVANALRIIYWADLNRYSTDAIECDIPEICYEFLMAHVRYRISKKERHGQMMAAEASERELALNLMRETLAGQLADPKGDEIEMDFSIYEDMN